MDGFRSAVFVGLLILVMSPIIYSFRGNDLEPDYMRTPVLLVHGHGLTPEYWDTLTTELYRRGYPVEYVQAVEILPSRMANAEAANRFIVTGAERLLEIARARRPTGSAARSQRIDIVSHSMGAVSSRWFAARIAPHHVRTFIAIAGANSGTDALCEHNDNGAREMCPAFAATVEESRIQVELNGTPAEPLDPTPFGIGTDPAGYPRVEPDESRNIAWFTIRIDSDEWIVPGASAELSGAGGVVVELPSGHPVKETRPGNFLMPGITHHDSLPRSEPVVKLVASLLAARD